MKLHRFPLWQVYSAIFPTYGIRISTNQEYILNVLILHRAERQEYYRKRLFARENPTQAMSIIVDGMDQAKTNLPHFQGWSCPKVSLHFKPFYTNQASTQIKMQFFHILFQ